MPSHRIALHSSLPGSRASRASLSLLIFSFCASSSVSTAQESAKEMLPGRYFRLLKTELALIEKRLETESADNTEFNARHYPSVLLAAAVLYAKQHPSNVS